MQWKAREREREREREGEREGEREKNSSTNVRLEISFPLGCRMQMNKQCLQKSLKINVSSMKRNA